MGLKAMIYQYCASGGSTTSSGENITVESPKCRYVWVDLPGNPAQVSFAPGGGGAAGPGDYYQQQQHKFTCAAALNEPGENSEVPIVGGSNTFVLGLTRSAERRVGTKGVSTCSSRWWPEP